MTNLDTISELIAAVLDEHSATKKAKAEDNPLHQHTLTQLTQGKGVRTSSDQHAALRMTAKAALNDSEVKPLDQEWMADDPEGAEADFLSQWKNSPAYMIEHAHDDGLADGKKDKSAGRMRTARARAARKAQIDAIMKSEVKPSMDRLAQAWMIVMPMSTIVEKIALSKQRWAARYLGTLVDDIPQTVIEAMVLVLAKSDKDLAPLITAAEQLGGIVKATGKIPGEQVTDEDKAERRQLAQDRKWLMGMANNRVMGALVDAYTSQSNLRWDNIDMIATVMASISGVGDDPLTARFKADRAPAMFGSRFQRPGGINPDALGMVIAGAITAKHLDALVELMLDEDNRRTDGAFMWAEHAEEVFMSTPHGEMKWQAVCLATQHMTSPRRARADAARAYVRNTFAFLPSLIVTAVQMFEWNTEQHIEYVDGHLVAHIESVFDGYLDDDGKRHQVVPALTYATPEEAGRAIVAHLGNLLTGEDVVASVVYA